MTKTGINKEGENSNRCGADGVHSAASIYKSVRGVDNGMMGLFTSVALYKLFKKHSQGKHKSTKQITKE